MILRRYGNHVLSVAPNFDARAMNEIGFQKDGVLSLSWEEFGQKYRRVSGHELQASADGFVQQEAEEKVLAALRGQLDELNANLTEGQVLVVESEAGKDYPKSREKQKTVVMGTENRLHFERMVDPPLRVAIYAETAG